MSRVECPWCGKWRCKHCGRVRYYTGKDEEVVRCARCGRTDGELEGVVHTNQYLADEHLYFASLSAPKTVEKPVREYDRNAVAGVLKAFRSGMITLDEAAEGLGMKLVDSPVDDLTIRLDNAITEAICDAEWTPLSVRYAMAKEIREKLGLKVTTEVNIPTVYPFMYSTVTHGPDDELSVTEDGEDRTEEYQKWLSEQPVLYVIEGEL